MGEILFPAVAGLACHGGFRQSLALPRKFLNLKIPLKPAPRLHPKTMTVQLLYHHVFFILQLIPPSRTLPASPAVFSSRNFNEG